LSFTVSGSQLIPSKKSVKTSEFSKGHITHISSCTNIIVYSQHETYKIYTLLNFQRSPNHIYIKSVALQALTNLGRMSSRRWQSFPTAPDGTGLTCGQHIESTAAFSAFLTQPLLLYSSDYSVYPITRLSGPRSRPNSLRKILRSARESNPGPLCLQSATLTTRPQRRSRKCYISILITLEQSRACYEKIIIIANMIIMLADFISHSSICLYVGYVLCLNYYYRCHSNAVKIFSL
jgi:hypothetical protein